MSRPSSCNQGSTGFPRKVINPAASKTISRGRSSTSATAVSKATSSLPRDPLQCPGRTIIILFSVEIFAKKNKVGAELSIKA